MSTAAEHYKNLLANHYVWMFGVSFEEKVAEQKKLFEHILKLPNSRVPCGMALDLGSGPGFQTVALAELGFSPVIAVDSSAELLAVLRAHVGSYPVEARILDLASLDNIELSAAARMAVCMGDTLTHLSSKEQVESFFVAVFGKLAPGGIFALTYRDLTHELTGVDRFLPVRSDDHTILTCFLEYENDYTVVVHDLLHKREEVGWKLEKSSYRKLRLSSDWTASALRKANFVIQTQESIGRLSLIVARKT
jgi:SAM-dependent methyltransferase